MTPFDVPTPDRDYVLTRRRLVGLTRQPPGGETRLYRWAARTGMLERVEEAFSSAKRTQSRRGLEETVRANARGGAARKQTTGGLLLALWAVAGLLGCATQKDAAAGCLAGFLVGLVPAVTAATVWYAVFPRFQSALVLRLLDARASMVPCASREVDTVQRWREAGSADEELGVALASWCACGQRRLWEFEALQSAWEEFAPHHQRRAALLRQHRERWESGREATLQHGMVAVHQAADLDDALPVSAPAGTNDRARL